MLAALTLLTAGAFYTGSVTHAEDDSAREQREKGLRMFIEIRKELAAAGQTNVVAKLDEMVFNMNLERTTHEMRQEVGLLTHLREAKYTNVIDGLELELSSNLHALSLMQEAGSLGPDQTKPIQAAKKYRAKYGLKGASPLIDEGVARLLDGVKEK
jgi:hypothetical protein